MEIYHKHLWEVSTEEAKNIQSKLRTELNFQNQVDPAHVKTIAAADISFNRYDDRLYAAVVLLSFPDLKLLEENTHQARATFPYIPGFLSFREIPPLLNIFKELRTVPQVILCDGQGIAHPRGFGLASHLGVLLDVPTIGCAKSLLVGEYQKLSPNKGSMCPLIYKNQQVGLALRTRRGVKPVFISVGHKIRLKEATKIVLQCCTKYRIPEPLRLSHRKVNEIRKKSEFEDKIINSHSF
jgi:deoxyribonuclease V